MIRISYIVLISLALLTCQCNGEQSEAQTRRSQVQAVIEKPGLVAFWDFETLDEGLWHSFYDAKTLDQSFPIYLRQIGDDQAYTPKNWPYTDPDAQLAVDDTGPFGNAIRFNRGYIYGSVPRDLFDKTPLNLHGRQAFTLIAWVKFIGQRHMVAGIWDEGGWDKYRGRRQVALFAGLFNQKGVIGHVSATGAASYPQSNIKGAQYARIRAIDAEAFENEEWICMAMSYDPQLQEVKAYLNGVMSPHNLSDPVAQDVFQFEGEQAANPLSFKEPIYSPSQFVLKFNGYDWATSGVYEHLLRMDLSKHTIMYERTGRASAIDSMRSRLILDVLRNGKSLLAEKIVPEIRAAKQLIPLPKDLEIALGDSIQATLEIWSKGQWTTVGSRINSVYSEGAPFTFGRALGLASEELEHGSAFYLDGVAVFNRVLTEEELQAIQFVEKAPIDN